MPGPRMSWKSANGTLPGIARGKRVKVRLRNGMVDGDRPISNGTPPGWRADESCPGKGPPMRWSHDGSPADVVEWDFV